MKQEAANADLGRLNAFSGHWDTEGEMKANPSGPSTRFKATDTYEWLAGGHFLLHRFDADMPDGNVQGVEIIGYNQEGKFYSMHSFDSFGKMTVMQARVDGDTWTYAGDGVRFTGGFRENGTVFAGLWELRSSEGISWQPWMEIQLRKSE